MHSGAKDTNQQSQGQVQQAERSRSPTDGALGRRYSLNLPPAEIEKLERRRASLEKLQLDKVAPWMHLYDFTEEENNKTSN